MWEKPRFGECAAVSSHRDWSRLSIASHRKTRPEKRVVGGEAEAHLIALACQAAPEGYERWSIRLLTKTAIQLEIVSQVGRETVRQVRKKMNANPG
jgi:hypothetical protein